MWVFGDFGLLMPALVPEKVKDRPDVLKWTNNGEYELQVRARLREHLQYFLDNYMPEGSYNPEIQATPDKDYNFRAYTTREAFAEGIKNIALAMDYEKFKVTSERFAWNKKYHTILNSIWSTVCRLNEPGGFYGPRSAENPRGYLPSSRYSSYNDSGWYADRHEQVNRRIGDTFGIADEEWDRPMVLFGDETIDPDEEWMTEEQEELADIIQELDSINIPMKDWWKYTSPREYSVLAPILKKHFSKKVLRSMRRKNEKIANKWVESYNGTVTD